MLFDSGAKQLFVIFYLAIRINFDCALRMSYSCFNLVLKQSKLIPLAYLRLVESADCSVLVHLNQIIPLDFSSDYYSSLSIS